MTTNNPDFRGFSFSGLASSIEDLSLQSKLCAENSEDLAEKRKSEITKILYRLEQKVDSTQKDIGKFNNQTTKSTKERSEDMSEGFNLILNELRDLRAENRIISNNIDHLKTENALRSENLEKQNTDIKGKITMLLTVAALIVTIFFAVINISIVSVNKNIDSIKESNSLQIQRDVAQEFLKQKK